MLSSLKGQIKESLIMAHPKLARLNRNRHHKMRWVHLANLTPNQKRTIGHSLEDSSRNKVMKTGTPGRVRKTDPRGEVRMVRTALEGATERDKKLLHPKPLCDVPQNLRSLWVTLQDDLPKGRAGTQVTGHKTSRCLPGNVTGLVKRRLNPAKPFQ